MTNDHKDSMTEPDPDVITAVNLAARWGITVDEVKQKIQTGSIPGMKTSRKGSGGYLVHYPSVIAALGAVSQAASSPPREELEARKDPDVVTTKVLAVRLGISEVTVRKMFAAGQIPGKKTTEGSRGVAYLFHYPSVLAALGTVSPAVSPLSAGGVKITKDADGMHRAEVILADGTTLPLGEGRPSRNAAEQFVAAVREAVQAGLVDDEPDEDTDSASR